MLASLPHLFILLNVADALLTMIGIARGKTELNPIARALMEQVGVLPAVVLVKLVSVVVVLAVAKRLPVLLPVGCVTVTAAVVWNLCQLVS
ncbi:MAG TPA: DUF5658 family protein [Sphingomicrobium sp.]|nr:DUF5658 family protein [Sphingomicrobium sp.]